MSLSTRSLHYKSMSIFKCTGIWIRLIRPISIYIFSQLRHGILLSRMSSPNIIIQISCPVRNINDSSRYVSICPDTKS